MSTVFTNATPSHRAFVAGAAGIAGAAVAAGYMAACVALPASSLLLDKSHATGGDSAVSGCITIGPWPERTPIAQHSLQ